MNLALLILMAVTGTKVNTRAPLNLNGDLTGDSGPCGAELYVAAEAIRPMLLTHDASRIFWGDGVLYSGSESLRKQADKMDRDDAAIRSFRDAMDRCALAIGKKHYCDEDAANHILFIFDGRDPENKPCIERPKP